VTALAGAITQRITRSLSQLWVAIRIPKSFWRTFGMNTRGETVTYKFNKDNYYVISGINPNGYEFYHKVFFYPTYWLEFEIT
jgi:hypothetical protein